jgi:NAD(P)-dependent dehydrogenase (short-subunit alcohol dehydrogenase family)
MDIRGGVFLVTGSASGLGAAVVEMLVAEGASGVIAADLAGQSPAHAQVRAVRCDVTSTGDVSQALAQAAALGPLRGVVHCAGIGLGEKTLGRDGPHDLERFERVLRINVAGTFNVARLAARAMAAQAPAAGGERGVLVHTASIAAWDGQAGQAAYAASKGAVAAMTLPIARDLARNAIRCVTIAPGVFETPMMASMPEEVRASLAAQVPFPPRLGRPAEFASLVREAISNPMLNGEVIRLDGALRMAAK